MDVSPRSRLHACADTLAFSSALPAGVAGGLTWVSSLAFGTGVDPAVIGLAASGTLVVYNIDRLRDLRRDRGLAPRRSAFVEENRHSLLALTALGAGSSAACALAVAPSAWALCAVVLALGLLHRRMKRQRGIKTLYLTLSWITVVVGLPLAARQPWIWPEGERFYWVTTTLGCALLSNLMASNLDRHRAREQPQFVAARRRLGPAIAVAGLGMGLGIVAPDSLRALAIVPAAEFIALCRFREGEEYGALFVDGALLGGAAVAALVMSMS